MDESYIRLPYNRPATASSIPEEPEHLPPSSRRGKQTSYESVIAFDLTHPTPIDESPQQQQQQSTDATDLRPMVDVYKGLTLTDLTDPLPGRAPDYPMHVLMQVAIQSSPLGKLRQCEIRDALIQRFPYFATAGKTWRNTLRHALTNRLSFYKVPKPPSVPGRGAYWSYRFTREPKRKSRPSSSRSNGGGKPGRMRGHSKRGSTFDEDDYDEDDDDEEEDLEEEPGVTMTDAPLTTPPMADVNDALSECFSRPSTSSQALYQPLSLDASIAAINGTTTTSTTNPQQSFREQRQSSGASFTLPTSSTTAPSSTTAFDIPQVLSPPQIINRLSTAPSSSSAFTQPQQQQHQFGNGNAVVGTHQHRPTTTSSLDVPLGILSISSPGPHQATPAPPTPGYEQQPQQQQQQQDYSSYLVPPPNSASSFTSTNYTTTTTGGADDTASAPSWLFPETSLFSSFSDDGMFAFSLPMDSTTDPAANFYYAAPPQSANSINHTTTAAANNMGGAYAGYAGGSYNPPPSSGGRCNWSSDSNLSATVFSSSEAVSPPGSRIGSSYGPGAGHLTATHSRPVTSHELPPPPLSSSSTTSSSGALLTPGLDLRPTSAGSLFGAGVGVTLPRPATSSFSSAGKDLWSAYHPLQQHQQQQQQQQQQIHQQQQLLVAQQQPQIQPHHHPVVVQSGGGGGVQESSLSMWNAGFVGAGFDGNLTGHPALDAFAHTRKWSV